MNFGKILKKFILSPFSTSFFTAIAVDPTPSKAFQNLYSNVFFRTFFVFLVVLQHNASAYRSLFYALGFQLFFYWMSSKEERKAIISNNFRKQDLHTFIRIALFMGFMYLMRDVIFE